MKTKQKKAADNLRILAASMVEKAKSGHPGGAMGGADFTSVLFSQFLSYDPKDPQWIARDRFFMDPGHMSPMLYGILAMTGKFSLDELKGFRQWGSPTPGHPEVDVMRGIENTSGPLGQGHTMAVGSAIAERFLVERFGEWLSHKTYAFISDGGIQEEISQGAGRIAGTLGLSNLIMFYDSNNIQLSTRVDVVTCEDTAAKYRSWNWNVIEVDGNNIEAIERALLLAEQEAERPTIIIGKTIMGLGARAEDGSSFEDKTSTHGQPLGAAGASLSKTIENLGGDPENPFVISPEVEELFSEREAALSQQAKERKAEETVWRSANPELSAKLDEFYKLGIQHVDFSAIEQKDNAATRAASATVLGTLAEQVENMIVASADLSNSDKTDGFLKKTKAFQRGDFSGAFLQAGVSELTMACIANGMALHGGVIPVCATFFVFSDYQKPAFRLSALMELPVIYVWSHDAFRVGEDGPTHQPVEQEAQVRLMEKLQNHSGKNSMMVLRPADVHETTVAWKLALENKDTPSALILSRQNIENLPSSSYNNALQAAKGAYVVVEDSQAEVTLLASGSEVSTLVDAHRLLEEKGVKSRVVSVISEGVFRTQDKAYQDKVLPVGGKKYGLTAGLPVTLEGLVGADGKVWGMNHFGFSAPYTVLDQKFGFTGEHTCKEILSMLKG